jgi:hypothetical protein
MTLTQATAERLAPRVQAQLGRPHEERVMARHGGRASPANALLTHLRRRIGARLMPHLGPASAAAMCAAMKWES